MGNGPYSKTKSIQIAGIVSQMIRHVQKSNVIEGIINPKLERVSTSLFESFEFFDPLDLPQVKYEMLCGVRLDKVSVATATRFLLKPIL